MTDIMNARHWRNLMFKNCVNCNGTLENSSSRSTAVRISTTCCISSTSDIRILDALLYVFGLSYMDFAQCLNEDDCGNPSYFMEFGENELSLCSDCLLIFTELCDAFTRFDNISKEDSLLKHLLKCKRNECPDLKKEPIDTDVMYRNADSNLQWNSDQGHSLSTEEDDDYLTKEGQNSEEITAEEDIKNTQVNIFTSSNKCITRQKRKSPVISNGNQERKIAHSSVISESEGNCERQSNLRLTRLRLRSSTSSLEREFKVPNYQDCQDSSSSFYSDVSEECPKKPKPSKQKSIVKKYRSKTFITSKGKVKTPQQYNDQSTNEISSFEEKEETHLSGKKDPNLQGVTSGKKQIVKTRLANGKSLAYVCNQCGKTVTKMKEFMVHLNGHKRETKRRAEKVKKRMKCPICGKVCKNEEYLKLHDTNYHSESATKYCDMCGKIFDKIEALLRHKRCFHTDDKQYECKTCGIKYKYKGSLQSHELTHQNPRPHVCEKCGISYTNKSNLNQHKTYHEDEERDKELFRCQECGKGLKNRKSLRKHMNAFHREDKKRIFKCLTCGKRASNGYNLKVHMRLHNPDQFNKKTENKNSNSVDEIPVPNVESLSSSVEEILREDLNNGIKYVRL